MMFARFEIYSVRHFTSALLCRICYYISTQSSDRACVHNWVSSSGGSNGSGGALGMEVVLVWWCGGSRQVES